MRATGIASTFDFSLRLLFFLVAPFLIAIAAMLLPITGTLIQVALTLGVFVAAETFRTHASGSRLIRILLGQQLKFDEYYRQHAPRPFLYYVFYPLLFPYWLTNRVARREFILFKGYTLISLVVLIGSQIAGYYRYFRPELGLKQFIPSAFVTLLGEALVVLMFVMPIATTVVSYHLQGARIRQRILFVVGILSVGASVFVIERRRDPVVSLATRARVRQRTEIAANAAYAAQYRALRDAWKALPKARADVEQDGKVIGAPLEAAHNALAPFYKKDEAFAFDLWFSRSAKKQTLVLYFEGTGKRAPIWLAMDRDNTLFHDPKMLPRGAFMAMRHAADGY